MGNGLVIARNGRPVPGFALGQAEELALPAAIVASPSPWAVALTTSVVGAATGWVIEELARKARGTRRRRG
jgi:membrane protein YqaA with SNARE-associated domain